VVNLHASLHPALGSNSFLLDKEKRCRKTGLDAEEKRNASCSSRESVPCRLVVLLIQSTGLTNGLQFKNKGTLLTNLAAISLSKTMRNGFYGCNEHSHIRICEVVSTEHFKQSDSMSNAFSLILFHWLTKGDGFYRGPIHSPRIQLLLSVDGKGKITVGRVGVEKHTRTRDSKIRNLNFQSVRKNRAAKLIIQKQVPQRNKVKNSRHFR